MGLQRLSIVFDLTTLDADEACSMLIDTMKSHKMLPEYVLFYGDIVSTKKLVQKAKSKQHFSIKTDDYSFHFGPVTAYKHILILIEQKTQPLSISWEDWVKPFLNIDGFMQAWISDIEYNLWQNAEDPLEYKVAGKDMKGVPMKSNDLPYPLEQMIIDISNNPCRRILQIGYVETIGGTMWLSPIFFKKIGHTISPQTLQTLKWLKFNIFPDEVLYLHIDNGVFENSSTEEQQRTLRKILFNN